MLQRKSSLSCFSSLRLPKRRTRSSRESEGERSSLPSLSVKEDALDNERG